MQDRIRDVLAAHGRMAVDPREVDDQADLYELGLTSHASVNVMLALEDAFDIEFPEEVLKKSTFASIRNIEPARSRQLGLRRFSACMADELGDVDPLLGMRPPKLDVKVTPSLSEAELGAPLGSDH